MQATVFRKFFFSFTGMFTGALVFIVFPSCAQQQQEQKPDIQIRVNKQRDKNGNVIRYDSSYVYSYSTGDSAAIMLHLDSLFKNGLFAEKDLFTDPFFHSPLFPLQGLHDVKGADSLQRKQMDEWMNSLKDFHHDAFLRDHAEQLKKYMERLDEYLKQDPLFIPAPPQGNGPADKKQVPGSSAPTPEKREKMQGRDI